MEKLASSTPQLGMASSKTPVVYSGKLQDGNECKCVKHSITEKELLCSVGLPLASKI